MVVRSVNTRERLPSHEELLYDYAQRLRNHTAGRRAVHVHLSHLQPHHRREHHLRIAASAFDALVRRFEGQCFRLTSGDIVTVLKGAGVREIDEAVLKLRYLFSEDPLAYGDDDPNGPGFCTWYDMEADYPAFFAEVQHLLHQFQAGRDAGPRPQGPAAVAAEQAAGEPMDPTRLARLESALSTADLTQHVRRQPVCAILPGQPPKPVFAELFVSIDELRRRIMPDVQIGSNRWLFQHLTEVLDRRVLRLLPQLEASVPITTSFNVNVASILSDDFMQFDREVRLRTAKSFILEIQPIDLFADIGAFFFARDYVRERGYKLCLDGMNHLSMPLVRRDEVGVDFYKVQWSPEVAHDTRGAHRERLVEAIRSTGAARIVLCRCDSEAAVAFGHALGINLFQGRHIDRLLAHA